MSMKYQTILASRPAAMVLALSLVAGLSVPFIVMPPAHSAQVVPPGVVELSPAPVDQIQSVPPNIAVTFDDSGSMAWDYLSDNPPFNATTRVCSRWGTCHMEPVTWGQGPWYCAGVINPTAAGGTINAHVMNGVYYNPNVTYVPPIRADGGSFPNAGDSSHTSTDLDYLDSVWNDGIQWNRDLGNSKSSGTTDFTNQTNRYGQTTYWQCPYNAGGNYDLGSVNNRYSTTARVTGGGPYYYQYTGPTITTDTYGNPDSAGLANLYTVSNWTAVAVPASQYQNWANWWAYYRTRNQMARTALSRVFGSTSLAAKTQSGGYGGDVRVAWQTLYDGQYGINDQFVLQPSQIISALIDTDPADCNQGGTPPNLGSQSLYTGTQQNPPDCYRSDFFNWIFQVPALSGTPTRSALNRAGQFFERGGPEDPNNIAPGDLHDPYWQPPQNGAAVSASNPGNELYCRANFSILITDGLWNGGQDGPLAKNLTLPTGGTALPDGVMPPDPTTAGVTSIYNPVDDGGDSDSNGNAYASLSDILYNYWANNLRSDLYNPSKGQMLAPYLPDTTAGLFTGAGNVSFQTVSGGSVVTTTIPAEEYFNPKNDPATWPHMSAYLIGLGVSGVLNNSDNTDCTSAVAANQDACDLRKGTTNSTGSVGWPTPNGSGNGIAANIDDTWHAALDARGQFFSAGNPQQLVDQLTSVLSNISARTTAPKPSAVNASVATAGTLSFQVGQMADWSGLLQAVTLNSDGTVGAVQWDAGAQLDAMAYSSRKIFTDTYTMSALCGLPGTNNFAAGTTFTGTTTFDACENTAANPSATPAVLAQGLQDPSLSGAAADTVANRVAYLSGDQTHEADGTYRKRKHILGAIIHSQPVYVANPSGNYNAWPATSPEGSGTESFDQFVQINGNGNRAGTVYVGANDGMLHAFSAPAPTCVAGTCTYTGGGELWAFIPRAVYANLGNLTSASDFNFRPTVDATPVTRDVYFSEGGTRNDQWHTILAGGVGLGGRGVYALDITNPSPTATISASPLPATMNEDPFSSSDVLWEFDSDMTPSATCYSVQGTTYQGQGPTYCHSSDLGYTVSQPNIGRIAYDNSWVVLVPNGYFPDCSKIGNTPTGDTGAGSRCAAIAAQAPTDSAGNPYSALFVMDAQTGKMLAELKTPTGLALAGGPSGAHVISFGLGTPVMGDYNNDQIDDVAFAGDLEGNLWKFDLRNADPSKWTVTLVYQGNADASGNQGLQPITTMPRLFPDPVSNSFMVVFGTGQYLGADDNGTTARQAIIAVRDNGTTYTQSGLTQDFLHETTAPATIPNPSGVGTIPNPNAGATLRCVTGKATDTCNAASASQVNDSSGSGGWFINLYTTTSGGVQNDLGERVVVNPGAIFASNTVVFETLLTGTSGSNPCNPSTQGAIMALNAVTGGPAGVSSLGGWPIIGARVSDARTSGSLPIVSSLGGGQAYIPGSNVAPGNHPLSIDAPIWRRRSWSEINENQ